MLPEMDGFQLCRAVRVHPTLPNIRILVFTASTDTEDRERTLESGADQSTTKPFKPFAMVETGASRMGGIHKIS